MPVLRPGDRIAILSPASAIKPEYVEGAVATLAAMGFEPMVMPHTLTTFGSFSASACDRLADLEAAILDPSIKAILCSRGGYGCVHLLPQLDRLLTERAADILPKWLIGFSDVTALHALWQKHGMASIHASMAKQLALGGPDDPLNRRLVEILCGCSPDVQLPCGADAPAPEEEEGELDTSTLCNTPGEGRGIVCGGNLAVLGGLIGTPFCPVKPGTILLIEDIAEPIYKVERILWQLRLAGLLDTLSGLIIGRFTDYRHPTLDHPDTYSMIRSFLATATPNDPTDGAPRLLPCPIAMAAPIGHIDANRPLLLGRPATLTVTPSVATLTY